MSLAPLFFAFVQIGLLSIGGGYAAIPLIRQQAVELHAWLSAAEFADLCTIAEMTPGPIAVNAATFVGTRVAGFPGAVVATLGCVAPSLCIVSALALLYFRFGKLNALQNVLQSLRPAVVALIAGAALQLLRTAVLASGNLSLASVRVPNLILCAAAFVLLRTKKPSPILTMLLCGVLGLAASLIFPQFA